MTTHRSLNKLEFKAHMSIHNKAEVPETEEREGNYTHDRFGKKHCVNESDGSSRIRRKKRGTIVPLFLLSVGSLTAPHTLGAAEATAKDRLHVAVESQPLDELMANDRTTTPEEPFAFFRDKDTSIGLNEDGDPNMSVRF